MGTRTGAPLFWVSSLVLANVVGCQHGGNPSKSRTEPDNAPAPAAVPTESSGPPGPSAGDPAGERPGSPEIYRATPEHTTFQGCRDLAPAQEGRAADSVRTIDWCDRDYGAWAKLTDGRANLHEYEEMGAPHDTSIWKLADVAYGDVDGDGQEEAAVFVTEENYGADGGESLSGTVYLFRFDGARLRQVAKSGGPFSRKATLSLKNGWVRITYAEEGRTCSNAWEIHAQALHLADPTCT